MSSFVKPLLFRMLVLTAVGICMMLLVLAGWIVWADYLAPAGSVVEVPATGVRSLGPVPANRDAEMHASESPIAQIPTNIPELADPDPNGSAASTSQPSVAVPDPAEPEPLEYSAGPAPIPIPIASGPEPPGERTVLPAARHQFRAQVRTVLDLLGQRQFDAAQQKIDGLLPMAVIESQRAQVAGLQQLHEAVGHFWAAYRDGYAGLAAGQELTVGRTTGVVVEANPDRLVVRVLGRNRRYDPAAMPLKLARVIAEHWFDTEAPSTAVHIGAALYVDPDGDRSEATALWRQARQQGQDIEPLIELLELAE